MLVIVVVSDEEEQYITIRQTAVLPLILHSLQLGEPRACEQTARHPLPNKNRVCSNNTLMRSPACCSANTLHNHHSC